MADGTRTHDNRNHNPGLYQLSYSHHWNFMKNNRFVVRPAGLEPTTPGLEGRCSIRLSYGHSEQPGLRDRPAGPFLADFSAETEGA